MTTEFPKFYRREDGVIVGGPYNCDQAFPVEELPDDHPDVLDFKARIEQALDAVETLRVSQ